MLRATGESMMDETPRIDRPENRSREAVKGKERSLRSASTHSQTPNYPDTTLTIIWFRHDNVGDRENDGSDMTCGVTGISLFGSKGEERHDKES